MNKEINIGIVGTRFMGKAHSNAYLQAPRFFDLPAAPVLHTACSRQKESLAQFAHQFGWQQQETSWEKMVADEAIDLVDICTPNNLHLPIALAAAQAGKHILCEKPMARNVEEARRMYAAAQEAGVVHMMIFNYRFVPALALAKRLIDEGKIGQIHHFNAVYYQDWLVDPQFPMTWRHDAEASGSGAHGDMNAHVIDLGRHLVGEYEAVNGHQHTFTPERPLPSGEGTGKVTTDDATTFLAKFQNGAQGLFQATRMATGRKNFLRLEIFGSEGGLSFNLERMNELEYFSRQDDPQRQGYTSVLVTEPVHPYMDAWWPAGHIIGWEHTFVHQVKMLLEGITHQKTVVPSFYDGLRCQQVLDAVATSAGTGTWVAIQELND